MSAEITFSPYRLPPLRSGRVTLTATHKVSAPGGEGETFHATQELFVKGARYQLDDAAVDSVFPPPGSQGEFANLLPHIVLTQATLAWQRSPAEDSEGTWLALLLFDETDPPPAPQATRLGDLLTSGTIFCAPRTAELGESLDDAVTVIDVPRAQFLARAPSLADLDWTAHVREAPADAKAAPRTEHAVVLGTRLPAGGHLSTVHLVSLEGYGPYLPGGAKPLGDDVTAVRLVSLRTWTFSAIDFKQSFEGLLLGLDAEPAGLQLPSKADADPAVANAFGLGYTALDHALRNGSRTVSWYRGPLLPLGARRRAFTSREAADQLLRYDPGSGMLDVSYAAAWELGRLLALHDRAYATALYRWKLQHTREQAEQLERDVIESALPDGHPAETHVARAAKQVLAPALAALPQARPRPAAPPPRVEGRETVPLAPLRPAAGTDQYQVVAWLTRLHLLHGVPFNHLVPDIRMLPAEAIRFFGVDGAWVAALLDGAFSLGTTQSAKEGAQLLRPAVLTAVRERLTHPRRALLGRELDLAAAPQALTGFLLRSAVVSGWPGMEVHGFADAEARQPLELLRLEPVAPALLLGLFAGTLARVDFREPPEGLHFGLDGAPDAWVRALRYADGDAIGEEIPGAHVPVTTRTDGVVEFDALARAMAPKVWSGAEGTFTAAEFALEMVEGGEAVSFQVRA
jgi:hypothetical protein